MLTSGIPREVLCFEWFRDRFVKAPGIAMNAFIMWTGVGGVVVVMVVVCSGVLWLLNVLHSDVGVDAPTARQLAEEDHERLALFRHVPALKSRLAWRELGVFPTPIHRARCSAVPISKSNSPPRTVAFFVKREDLSSNTYGGNKVRTLQHQLGGGFQNFRGREG